MCQAKRLWALAGLSRVRQAGLNAISGGSLSFMLVEPPTSLRTNIGQTEQFLG